MRTLTTLVIGTLVGGLTAQTTYQAWDMHPGLTSFTSRGNIGTGVGSIYQGVHSTVNRGVLDICGKAVISRFNTITQDQNCGTRETYAYVVRKGTDTAGPGVTAGDVLGSVTGLMPPAGPNSPCAWSLTTTLATPITVPIASHWSYGMELRAAPNWTMDGQSVHSARDTAHNAHGTYEDQAWQIVGTATAANQPSLKRSWRLTVFVADGAIMKLRCGARQGYGGSFPKSSTSASPLAWDARLNGGANCSGVATMIGISAGRFGGLKLGIASQLYLKPPCVIVAGGKANNNGIADVELLPFVPGTFGGAGTFHVQGAFLATKGIKLSNCQAVIP